MKRYISFFTLVALWGFLAGCETGEGCVGGMPPSYRFLNQSEHIVSLVNRPACRELPDSLILRPDDSFIFDSGLGSDGISLIFFNIYGYTARLVYYDGQYVIKVRDLPIHRQPTERSNFEVNAEGLTFTFTDEDYAYAVEHGADLMAE